MKPNPIFVLIAGNGVEAKVVHDLAREISLDWPDETAAAATPVAVWPRFTPPGFQTQNVAMLVQMSKAEWVDFQAEAVANEDSQRVVSVVVWDSSAGYVDVEADARLDIAGTVDAAGEVFKYVIWPVLSPIRTAESIRGEIYRLCDGANSVEKLSAAAAVLRATLAEELVAAADEVDDAQVAALPEETASTSDPLSDTDNDGAATAALDHVNDAATERVSQDAPSLAPSLAQMLVKKDMSTWMMEEAIGLEAFESDNGFRLIFCQYISSCGGDPNGVTVSSGDRLDDRGGLVVEYTATTCGGERYIVAFNRRIKRVVGAECFPA